MGRRDGVSLERREWQHPCEHVRGFSLSYPAVSMSVRGFSLFTRFLVYDILVFGWLTLCN